MTDDVVQSSGVRNIAFGLTSLSGNTTGSDNLAIGLESLALDALIRLHAEMQREFHHHAVDLPVSVNLDDWIARLATIIAALRTTPRGPTSDGQL